eukprot:scaffold92156_cov66-Phaeocystis_antarctica.AAC.6
MNALSRKVHYEAPRFSVHQACFKFQQTGVCSRAREATPAHAPAASPMLSDDLWECGQRGSSGAMRFTALLSRRCVVCGVWCVYHGN